MAAGEQVRASAQDGSAALYCMPRTAAVPHKHTPPAAVDSASVLHHLLPAHLRAHIMVVSPATSCDHADPAHPTVLTQLLARDAGWDGAQRWQLHLSGTIALPPTPWLISSHSVRLHRRVCAQHSSRD